VETLKKRSEFLRIRGGARWATASFVLEAKRRPDASKAVARAPVSGASMPRFGFTVTKKLGSAVVRNRIRRRLKAAVDELAERNARADCDYVLVARKSAMTRPFASLLSDLEQAFARVNGTIKSSGGSEDAKRTGAP
jgi:ribonuclease P protein component